MYELSSGYLRGICGASSGRGGAEESCYKGTKKNRDMQVYLFIHILQLNFNLRCKDTTFF